MKPSVTITEIAKECGVSIATVSRVLNGKGPVAPSTKAQIEAVIEKYHYSPNSLAQSLVRRQSQSLGVIMPDITNPYFSTLFTEVERAAHNSSFSVILCNTMFRSSSLLDQKVSSEEVYFQMMLDKKVDGVLIAGGQIDLMEVSEEYISALSRLASSIPVVVIGRTLPDIPCTFVDKETREGVSIALKHLMAQGHRRIAFVGGEEHIYTTDFRLKAYRETLEKMHLEYVPELVSLSDYYMPDGYTAAAVLLERQVPFTAMLAMNDNVALGAVRAIRDQGLSVPEDIALVSCDQFYNGDYLLPRLSSVDRHNNALGKYVIQLLLNAIQETDTPVDAPLLPQLIVRESSLLRVRK